MRGDPSQLLFLITNIKQTSNTQAQCYPHATCWPLASNPTKFLPEESDAQGRASQRGQDFQGTGGMASIPKWEQGSEPLSEGSKSTEGQTDSRESSPGSVNTGACTCRCRLCSWGTCASHP